MDIERKIRERLGANFSPSILEVIDETRMHNVPLGSQSHFKITLVSNEFCGKTELERHQAVYQSLCEELKTIHALSLHVFTEEEWQHRSLLESPLCLGGSRALKKGE